MNVRPFDAGDAATVAGWASPGGETDRWCGLERVDAETIVAWSGGAGVEAWVAEAWVADSGDPPTLAAYGELWLDDEEDEAELAHLIVAPTARGRGVGRAFVAALAERAHARHPLATLRVVPDNDAAIRCYAAAGFERATSDDEAAWNAGQPRTYVWMLRHRQAASRPDR